MLTKSSSSRGKHKQYSRERRFWIGVLNQRFKTLILPSQNKHERSLRCSSCMSPWHAAFWTIIISKEEATVFSVKPCIIAYIPWTWGRLHPSPGSTPMLKSNIVLSWLLWLLQTYFFALPFSCKICTFCDFFYYYLFGII